MAYEIYEMAKLFSQRPSDIALLDDCVGPICRFIFDSTIAAFGRGVHARLDEVSTSNNPSIVQAQRAREWDRIFGGDGAWAFADPTEIDSPHARVVGQDESEDDDDFDIGNGWVM
jgi:hypothetical protein